MKTLLKAIRVAAVMIICFGAATILGPGRQEASAELSGCLRECDGLTCRFAAYMTQCDEEDIPEAKQCTNFACSFTQE
jgi:hypothetical protein